VLIVSRSILLYFDTHIIKRIYSNSSML
jgi:hypothetical protein